MQIKGLHKGVYKLYSYARKQECLDAYRKKYVKIVKKWKALKDAGTDPKKIKTFVGKQKPYIMAYINQYDVIYTYKLFGSEEKPFFWIPIDFASILFGYGINPESYFPKDKENFFKEIGIDASKYHEHNALDDAKLLREVYLKMMEL